MSDFITVISAVGLMVSPLYAILLWQSKRILNTEKCLQKIKTALQMKFPELLEILK
jgi:hypothetical protein